MADENLENTDEICDSCGRPLNDSRDFKSLKAEVATLREERDGLKTQVLDRAIADAGYDPQLGIVKRLAGEYSGEMTADAFRAFAEAEGLAAVAKAEDTKDNTADLSRLQDREDALRNASTSPQPDPDLRERIRQAEETGDVRTSMALKRQMRDEVA